MVFAIKQGLAYEFIPCSDATILALDEEIMNL